MGPAPGHPFLSVKVYLGLFTVRRWCQVVPVEFESLGEESPVGSVRARRVQAAADLLPDEVGDLKGARAGQSRAALIHHQEISVEWPGVLQQHNTTPEHNTVSHCLFLFSLSRYILFKKINHS